MRYLLLVSGNGQVILGDVDSGAQVPVGASPHHAEATETAAVSTAVWSAEGQWTAWSTDPTDPDDSGHIALHDEATDATRLLAESVSAFYLCPSPCGRYLSHLSPGPLGLELGVTDIRTGELHVIERGQPLYWSWSLDSARIAVHVGHRVLVASRDGSSPIELTDEAGAFTAPWWITSGTVAYVAGDRIVSRSVSTTPIAADQDSHAPHYPPAVHDHEIGPAATLVDDAGSGRFALDPDGRRLALVVADLDQPALVILDLLTGTRTVVPVDHVVAFFWSPDGRYLATLAVASADELQWVVFDGDEANKLESFRPTRAWVGNVLPFFEQYTHSHAFWSADSQYLVACALASDGSPFALVQSATSPFTNEQLPDSQLAWWANE